LSHLLSLSKNPTGIWLARITNVLIDNYISPSLMIGITTFRTRVLYVPQRPSLLPGSPRDFLYSVSELKSHKDHRNEKSDKGAPHIILRKAKDISEQWGVDEELWERDWSNLSGGEAQRIALAVALVMDTAEIMLLDGLCSKFFSSKSCWMNGFFLLEPTSALDPESSAMVENFLVQEIKAADRELKALIWITHSEEQAKRVGTRFLVFAGGKCEEVP